MVTLSLDTIQVSNVAEKTTKLFEIGLFLSTIKSVMKCTMHILLPFQVQGRLISREISLQKRQYKGSARDILWHLRDKKEDE